MTNFEIPKGPESITAEWLTKMLRQAKAIQEAKVVALESKSIGIGIGFVGRIKQYTLHYDHLEPEAPQFIVAKFPSIDPALQRYWQTPPSLYEIENLFYKHIAQHTTLKTPNRYYGEFDHESQIGVLILEDLTSLRPGDQVAGSSLSDAEIVVHDMAHFHADFWESNILKNFHWLGAFNRNVANLHQRYLDAWPSFFEKFGSQLPQTFLPINEKVAQHGIAIRNQLAETHQTFVHGDFRSDNLLMDKQNVVVVDWGGYRKGTCMWDLNQYICQSLTVDDRRQHEKHLLNLYHKTLQSRDVTYNTKQFEYDYRSTTALTWVKIVRANAGLNIDVNERSQKLATEVITRISTALSDHFTNDLIPK